jgi:hypothetical protein
LNGRLFVLAFAPLLLIHSLAPFCRADIILSDRLSSYQVTFSDPSFADANAHYQVDIVGHASWHGQRTSAIGHQYQE